MKERGIECRWVQHPWDIEDWKSKIDEDTRFLYMEMPSNPQQSFTDIKALADLAHAWGIPLIIDATCATPALMRPIAHGADIVVHSLTKSITSGGLAIGGALISRKPITTKVKNDHPLFKESFAEYVKFLPYRDNGPASSPVNAIFALNDLRTLRSKMDLVSANCQTVAEYLQKHPKVYQVDYLGLPSLPSPRDRQEVHDARRLGRRDGPRGQPLRPPHELPRRRPARRTPARSSTASR